MPFRKEKKARAPFPTECDMNTQIFISVLLIVTPETERARKKIHIFQYNNLKNVKNYRYL